MKLFITLHNSSNEELIAMKKPFPIMEESFLCFSEL